MLTTSGASPNLGMEAPISVPPTIPVNSVFPVETATEAEPQISDAMLQDPDFAAAGPRLGPPVLPESHFSLPAAGGPSNQPYPSYSNQHYCSSPVAAACELPAPAIVSKASWLDQVLDEDDDGVELDHPGSLSYTSIGLNSQPEAIVLPSAPVSDLQLPRQSIPTSDLGDFPANLVSRAEAGAEAQASVEQVDFHDAELPDLTFADCGLCEDDVDFDMDYGGSTAESSQSFGGATGFDWQPNVDPSSLDLVPAEAVSYESRQWPALPRSVFGAGFERASCHHSMPLLWQSGRRDAPLRNPVVDWTPSLQSRRTWPSFEQPGCAGRETLLVSGDYRVIGSALALGQAWMPDGCGPLHIARVSTSMGATSDQITVFVLR
ncbi:MAG: hypothetical protein Q9198_006816 [Flavoplaca austrocitrina]